MARCACGNATCSCIIQAGTGITISGNGSPTRPYRIALTTGAVVATLQIGTIRLRDNGGVLEKSSDGIVWTEVG